MRQMVTMAIARVVGQSEKCLPQTSAFQMQMDGVVVFPHHLGPCISTTPAASSCSCNNLSAIRSLYICRLFITTIFHRGKDTSFLLIIKEKNYFYSVS